ncbi:MAG: hypothetical protein HUJ22_12335 [Gracilimonas sp.]|uniref:hypothetical protein n=1 Tax=Gracilimonas sp. TaxID=1974203 RepID=UPI00198B786A|nr:hypothetical protein [Gracilimonas sp.]MBD3617347.1 hypothetical protein [Gracilimonas sp.]
MRSLFRVAPCIILLLLTAGCQQEEGLSKQISEAQKFNPDEAAPAELIRDRDFSVGSHETVNNIGAIAVDGEETVYVVDEHRKKIGVFDGSGNNIGSLGSLGRDPGDFQNPAYLEVEGQNLYAYDQSLFRAYRYSLPELELEEITELEFTARSLGVDSLSEAKPFAFEVLNDGNYLVAFQTVNTPQDRKLVYYKVNPEGEVISNQLLAFKNKRLYVDEAVTPPLIIMLPYEPETLTVTDSGGLIYTAFSDHFLIKVTDRAGQNVESRYYPFEKYNLNRSDAIDLYTDTHRRRAIRRASLPAKWPALAALKTDDQDRLWVATIISDLSQYRWFVLEPSGEPVAVFDLPRESEIMLIKDGYVYTKALNRKKYTEEVRRYKLNY